MKNISKKNSNFMIKKLLIKSVVMALDGVLIVLELTCFGIPGGRGSSETSFSNEDF